MKVYSMAEMLSGTWEILLVIFSQYFCTFFSVTHIVFG